MILIYEPPHLNLPTIKYAGHVFEEPTKDYQVSVKIRNKKDSKKEIKEDIAELKEVNALKILKSGLEDQLERWDGKGEIDLTDYPLIISSKISHEIMKNDSIETKEYGWHVVSGSIGKPNSEVSSLCSTVDKIESM